MNLEDVIDPEYGLQQDTFSEGRPKFGEHGQLEVIGWSGITKDRKKHYILKCHHCKNDNDLYGHGVFRSKKSNLTRGKIPCGCSKSPHWTKEQWKVKAQRKSAETGYEFVEFVGEWCGAYTKIKLVCKKHGMWDSGTLNSLVNDNRGCPQCKNDKVGAASMKSDSDMIASFFSTGAFHPSTKFWRSDRKTNQGNRSYWNVYCPDCDSVGETFSGGLQKGNRPCMCPKSRQKQAYINFVDDNKSTIAVKFGVANNTNSRVKQQDRSSYYTVSNYLIYQFNTKQSCLAAERECKQTLVCGVVDKELMPDGWTETTYPYNIDKIISIYEKHGGVRQEC